MKQSLCTGALILAGLIGGLTLLAFGVNELTSTRVTCNGNTMSSGEQCFDSVRSGRWGRSTRLHSYDEQKESNQRSGIGFIVIGAILVAFAVGLGVLTVGSKSDPGPTPPPRWGPPPPPPHY